jgi:signal transduction histidine kinase
VETDEFTRRAIDAALADVDTMGVRDSRRGAEVVRITEVYRYLAERLRHRLRNKMLGIQVHVEEVKEALTDDLTGHAETALANLNDDVIGMGRALEAADVDPAHFEERPVGLYDWLKAMNQRYAAQYSPVSLKLAGDSAQSFLILASDYLLETIFWNLWLNAQQAVGLGCEITIEMSLVSGNVELFILDNGPGFAVETTELVFQQAFSSSRSINRGRGLLEVEDAVERLGGKVMLFARHPTEYRIRMIFPVSSR